MARVQNMVFFRQFLLFVTEIKDRVFHSVLQSRCCMLSSGPLVHGMCTTDPTGFPLLQEVVKPLAEILLTAMSCSILGQPCFCLVGMVMVPLWKISP